MVSVPGNKEWVYGLFDVLHVNYAFYNFIAYLRVAPAVYRIGPECKISAEMRPELKWHTQPTNTSRSLCC